MSSLKELLDRVYAQLMLVGLIIMAFIPRIWKAVLALMLLITIGVTGSGNTP